MDTALTLKDIDGKQQKKVFVQDYSKKTLIQGVKIVELRNITGEDGDLTEVARFSENGEHEQFPGFKIRQITRSLVIPGAIKAFHLHFFQDDIWHILPGDKLTIGLWDVRKDSPTKGVTMKLPLGGGKSHLVFIPRGVAHGAANISLQSATIIYLVNQQFNIEKPDENRLPWDSLGEEFWDAPKE